MVIPWRLIVVFFILFEWFLRFFMLFVVPKGRRPSSSTAWLMLIMLEPSLGTLTYAVFGTPRLPKYRDHLQKYADSHITKELGELKLSAQNGSVIAADLSSTNEQFVKLNHALGGLPVFGGNSVYNLDAS